MKLVSSTILETRSLGFRRSAKNVSREIIRNFNMTVHRGEFVSIVGASGCGKSTIIGLLSGSLAPDSGTILFPAGRPKLGVQFQAEALFPWRKIWGNLGYPLEIAGQNKIARRDHAAQLCKLVELEPDTILDRYPSEISGGERRRISLAMALSAHPELLLLDEATGSLDWLTRRSMQEMLQKLCATRSLTTISVTHDVEEAVWLSDRVLVMEKGGRTQEFVIDLPRPRDVGMRESSAFISVVAQVATALSNSLSTEVFV